MYENTQMPSSSNVTERLEKSSIFFPPYDSQMVQYKRSSSKEIPTSAMDPTLAEPQQTLPQSSTAINLFTLATVSVLWCTAQPPLPFTAKKSERRSRPPL